MRHSIATTIFAATISAVTPALADDCQTVADAYYALVKVPAYRQTTTLNGKLLMESVIVGDVLYHKNESGWMSMNLGPGGRAANQKKALPGASSLRACARVGRDTVDGKAAVMYDYIPPAIQGLGESGPQRVWIGSANGLPLRMTSEKSKTEVMLSFENVTAPVQ